MLFNIYVKASLGELIHFLLGGGSGGGEGTPSKLFLTLKMPRKTTSDNVICLCCLLHLLVWTLIRLLLEEQSDLGPNCLQQ